MDVRSTAQPLARWDGRASRRALLIAAALLPVAGCSGSAARKAPASPAAARSTAARLAGLERSFGARLGVYARDTGTGATVTYRADERFPMCSVFKVLAAAAILHRDTPAQLARRVRYGRADLVPPAPVTTAHLTTGLTVGRLCQAAVSDSDSTAANLLMLSLNGPSGVTSYARSLGDEVTQLDRTEPALNQAVPGDDRDTTSPRAIGTDYAALVLGSALAPANRALLTRWMLGDTTGAGRIRDAVPPGWRVADKTGTGRYGVDNDIAILWPPGRAPLVLAVMSTRTGEGARPSDALVFAAARTVLPAL